MLKTLALASAATFALAGAAAAQDMAATHDFLMKAGASDKFEITEAKMVEMRTHNPKLKKFAMKMVHDHTQSTMKLKTAAESSMGHKLKPPMLDADQEKMVSDLRAAHGADFDKTYVDQQVQAHQMALDLMKGYEGNHDYPKIHHAVTQIIPVVQMHSDMITDMQGKMR